MNAPVFVEANPVFLAMREIMDNAYAVALAKVCAVARREAAGMERPAQGDPARAAFNIVLDAFTLTRDVLDDIITVACVSHDLDRSALPSTGEMVDLLARAS